MMHSTAASIADTQPNTPRSSNGFDGFVPVSFDRARAATWSPDVSRSPSTCSSPMTSPRPRTYTTASPAPSAPSTPRHTKSKASTVPLSKLKSNGVALVDIPETEEERLALDNSMVSQLLGALELNQDNTREFKWKSIGNKDGCEMFYSKSKGSKLHAFRGVCDMECPASLLEQQFEDEQIMRMIDPMCTMVEELRSSHLLGPRRQVLRATFDMPSMVTNRDFVWYQLKAKVNDKLYVSVGRSIEHEDFETTKEYVRGIIAASGYVIESLDETTCRVHYFVQTDPRGWVPTWSVNKIVRQQASNPAIVKSKLGYFRDLQSRGLTSGSDPRNQR